jgi:osmotically-inducible protein OsmY
MRGPNMQRPDLLPAALLSLCLGTALCACQTYKKCGLTGCTGDTDINAMVASQFDRYAPLYAVRVQTLDKVVYLTGQVDTDVERFLAVSVAGNVDGVSDVVDSISVNNIGR